MGLVVPILEMLVGTPGMLLTAASAILPLQLAMAYMFMDASIDSQRRRGNINAAKVNLTLLVSFIVIAWLVAMETGDWLPIVSIYLLILLLSEFIVIGYFVSNGQWRRVIMILAAFAPFVVMFIGRTIAAAFVVINDTCCPGKVL